MAETPGAAEATADYEELRRLLADTMRKTITLTVTSETLRDFREGDILKLSADEADEVARVALEFMDMAQQHARSLAFTEMKLTLDTERDHIRARASVVEELSAAGKIVPASGMKLHNCARPKSTMLVDQIYGALRDSLSQLAEQPSYLPCTGPAAGQS